MSFSEIFELLEEKSEPKTEISLPLSMFKDRRVGMLEQTVVYLKDSEELKFSQIAKLLNRDQRTIWVTYHKAKEKLK